MSTTTPTAEAGTVQTFRGRTLEEVLPQIREQLGADAIVVRQRDGLMGGIGGFFQQRFVEVDARAGTPRVDTYDEQPAAPEPAASPEPEPPAEPTPFAALLAAAEPADEGGPRISVSARPADSLSSPEPAPFEASPAALEPTLTHELTARGMSHAFAERLVADAEAHELPFADGDMRTAVRRALARRLPTTIPHRAGGLAVAFAGPGSTACADALATAYKRAGRDARTVASLDKARGLVERNEAGVLAVDLPPAATDRAEVDALAARVATLELDELVVAMPGDLDLPTARALLDRLQPLSPTALVLSLAADDACVVAALELSATSRLPIAYIHEANAGIAPADPTALAERLLP